MMIFRVKNSLPRSLSGLISRVENVKPNSDQWFNLPSAYKFCVLTAFTLYLGWRPLLLFVPSVRRQEITVAAIYSCRCMRYQLHEQSVRREHAQNATKTIFIILFLEGRDF
jgi:hypothetical protein